MTIVRETDTRYVYGATCAWHGPIQEVGRIGSGLPACPHCGGVLFEVDTEEKWWAGVDAAEADGRPGYRKFIESNRVEHLTMPEWEVIAKKRWAI